MKSYFFNKTCLSICTIIAVATCAMPLNKVEARGEGAVVAAAGLGLLFGAAIASDANHHRHHRRQAHRVQYAVATQQQTMNYVLINYNPAFHDAWVRYVVVDCAYILNPVQQDQLLSIMDQRRNEMGFNTHTRMR
jgi:hypothetical protein